MHSFNLVQVVVASLAAANVAAGLQAPAQAGLAVRSVRREAFLLGSRNGEPCADRLQSALMALAAIPVVFSSPVPAEAPV